MTDKPKSFEFTGKYVAVGLFVLTAIVGSLFIYLGPKATGKTPGVIHVGIRYLNEGTLDFLRYGKKGPDATLRIIAADGSVVYALGGLKMGRNLVPLEGIDNGLYTVQLTADDFLPAEVPVIVEGRMLNPPKDAKFAPGTHADYNMIGVRFVPLAP